MFRQIGCFTFILINTFAWINNYVFCSYEKLLENKQLLRFTKFVLISNSTNSDTGLAYEQNKIGPEVHPNLVKLLRIR